MSIISAHIMAIFGSIFSIMSDKSNDNNKVLVLNAVSNFFCGLQYFLLGAITGGITSIVAMPRNYLFHKYNNKIPLLILFSYIAFLFIVNYSNITSLLSFLPILLVIIYTLGLYSNNQTFLKCAILLTCFLEIIYDVHYKAYVGIVVCSIDILFVTYSVVKLNKEEVKVLA